MRAYLGVRWRACLLLGVAGLAAGCDHLRERRLRGAWESEGLPKRILELKADGTYSRRLSGKTLGFLSELAGPERGTWRVEGASLVLAVLGSSEKTERLAIRELSGDSCWLGGEKWSRVVARPPSP